MLPGGYGIMPASYPMNAGPDTNDAPLFQDNLMTAYLRAGRTGANWEVLPASASGTAYRVYALLSLANAVFPGARYLFIGCEGDDDRGDEMLFGDLACAGGINPAFTTRRCMLLGKRYCIVEISDSCSKPFMLAAGVKDSGRTLSPGVVYVHTPVPAGDGIRQATPEQIEAIWKDRFGLGPSAAEYATRFLYDRTFWHQASADRRIYRPSPQYSVSVNRTEVTGGVYWWTARMSSLAVRRLLRVKHGTRIIGTLPLVEFKKSGLTLPFPDMDEIISPRKQDNADFCGDIFSYVTGTLKHAVLFHLLGECDQDRLKGLPVSEDVNPQESFSIMIFNSESEKARFISVLENNIGRFFNDYLSRRSADAAADDPFRKEKVFSRWADEQYDRFRRDMSAQENI